MREKGLVTDTVASLLFRYLPAIGRFLIVVTFIEDSLRMITQWNDQLLYLRDYRKSKHGFWPRPSYIRSHPPWGRIADRL